jgi:2-polyprenyl-6-methoxyphenol hydroxylase-like FAD-dependent oxidoreductase
VNSVQATLREVATNTLRHVRARYLVAADGVHGPLRGLLGIEQHGVDHLHESVSVLFPARIWHIAGEHRYGIYGITHPEAAGTLLPAGSDRWIYAFESDPAGEQVPDYTVDRLCRLIRHAIGDVAVEPRIAHVGAVTFGAFIADRFRDGSAFLIGDAAHRITPRGGTGMNLAIADGYDLGWKLAWVLRGWSDASLLDTYEAERRPPAEHNLERSMDPMGSRRPAADEVHVDLGGRLPHVWLPHTNGRTSTLDVLGRGLTLFTVAGSAWQRAAAELDVGMPMDVRLLDPFTARALGVRGPGALLVRPDGVSVGSWFDDADAIDALCTATVRARCPSGSMQTYASSERAMPVSPQHVA